ncbi:hypothetical protein APHAL10511_007415 [Amanita phalloides]|nr:hypothetical protein APHAL10511_007415 [Amanita phalloides]
MAPVCIAYYCSGHGYGHATRVSAFACHLLKLADVERPVILYIISSAPRHIFVQSIACGARYRHAEIDPVIVQPLAYCVDRGKSVQILQNFLKKKDLLLAAERQWLLDIHANAVLSDAAFLGCQAAKLAGIRSILVTNFTFDSVYSYLSTPLLDSQPCLEDELFQKTGTAGNSIDIPVSHSILRPLVEQIHVGYRCADLLIRLPGHIPIPSFATFPTLPSSGWVDTASNRFLPEIADHLLQPVETYTLHPSITYPTHLNSHHRALPRSIISAPLLVRPPSTSGVYTVEGRSQLLASIGVPDRLHDSKVLIVSFGGQFFRGPSRSGSRSPSQSSTPKQSSGSPHRQENKAESPSSYTPEHHGNDQNAIDRSSASEESKLSVSPKLGEVNSRLHRLASPSHIWIPGAPPTLRITPPTPLAQASARIPCALNDTGLLSYLDIPCTADEENDGPRLLPDSSWIAVICGVSKEQWNRQLDEQELDLPEHFFVAPKDIYMPDLTAVGDVLLGKLGYGTVSECVDACTAFVYVSRPLFIEEHGLRLLLEKEGVGMELSRTCYEGGDWADAIEQAWILGRERKAKKRDSFQENGMDRQRKIRELAETVLRWAEEVLT